MAKVKKVDEAKLTPTQIAHRKNLERREAQLEMAEELMLKGYGESRVVVELKRKWPELRDPKQIRERIIFRVLEHMAREASLRGREEKRNLMRARLEYGWRRAMSAGEYAPAVNFQKQLAILDDLNDEGRQISVSLGIGANDRSVLERRMKELAAKAPELVAALRLPASVRGVIEAQAVEEKDPATIPTYAPTDAARAERTARADPGLRDAAAADVHSDSL